MVYGQKPKYFYNGCLGAKPRRFRGTSNDYPLVGVTTIGVGRKLSVGENPLNRNGLTSAHNGGG